MKVILLQDVAKIGRRSELVQVPDGYALNKLIPSGMAEPATATNQKRIERMQASVAAGQEADQVRFETASKALADKVVQIATDVNEKGHLFKAVSEIDIAEAVKAEGIDVEASMIVVGEPIKEVGEHEVELVRGDDKEKFKIEVIKK